MNPDIGASDQSLPNASHLAGFSVPPVMRFLFVLKLMRETYILSSSSVTDELRYEVSC